MKERKLLSTTHLQKQHFHIILIAIHRITFVFCFIKDKRDSSRPFLPESDLVPLNEYRRNRLIRLSEMLRDERNRFKDAMKEKGLQLDS